MGGKRILIRIFYFSTHLVLYQESNFPADSKLVKLTFLCTGILPPNPQHMGVFCNK